MVSLKEINSIKQMEESYMKEFMETKQFKISKPVRQTFRSTKFGYLMKREAEYNQLTKRLGAKSSRKGLKKLGSKKKYTKPKKTS